LHATCDPPILHGNLTCDTIFIQHNGLVKIGSVAPDIIHQNVKTCRDNISRNRHFLAPEWGTISSAALNTALDIYAFGMCALETAALELLPSNQPPASSSSSSGGASSGTSANGASANGNVNQQVVVDNEGSYGIVTEESVQKTIDSLEDVMQKDFIRKCLNKNPEDRPTARELLFHPVLFEVHSLKLLAAHILVNTPGESFFTFCVLKDLLG
jgi:nuclear receptor-binding protein